MAARQEFKQARLKNGDVYARYELRAPGVRNDFITLCLMGLYSRALLEHYRLLCPETHMQFKTTSVKKMNQNASNLDRIMEDMQELLIPTGIKAAIEPALLALRPWFRANEHHLYPARKSGVELSDIRLMVYYLYLNYRDHYPSDPEFRLRSIWQIIQ